MINIKFKEKLNKVCIKKIKTSLSKNLTHKVIIIQRIIINEKIIFGRYKNDYFVFFTKDNRHNDILCPVI